MRAVSPVVRVDLHVTPVDFADGHHLGVVAPRARLRHFFQVVVERAHHEVPVERCLFPLVRHHRGAHGAMRLLGAVDLVSHGAEEAVAVAHGFFYLQAFLVEVRVVGVLPLVVGYLEPPRLQPHALVRSQPTRAPSPCRVKHSPAGTTGEDSTQVEVQLPRRHARRCRGGALT